MFAIAVLAPIVAAGFILAACGVNWFPKCDEPGNKCPPIVDPNDPVPYPRAARDASDERG